MSDKLLDMLGVEVKENDFVAIIHIGEMKVGVVQTISKTGKSAMVLPITSSKNVTINYSNKILVIDDQTKIQAFMRKLTR